MANRDSQFFDLQLVPAGNAENRSSASRLLWRVTECSGQCRGDAVEIGSQATLECLVGPSARVEAEADTGKEVEVEAGARRGVSQTANAPNVVRLLRATCYACGHELVQQVSRARGQKLPPPLRYRLLAIDEVPEEAARIEFFRCEALNESGHVMASIDWYLRYGCVSLCFYSSE